MLTADPRGAIPGGMSNNSDSNSPEDKKSKKPGVISINEYLARGGGRKHGSTAEQLFRDRCKTGGKTTATAAEFDGLADEFFNSPA